MHQMTYLFRESFKTLVRHKGIMSLSIIIMSLTLLVLAVFLLVTDNVYRALDRTRDELKIYVYLQDRLSNDDIEQRYKELLVIESVESVVFISKSEAMQEFQKQLGDDQYILESLETNPLPASFRVELKKPYRQKKDIEAFVAKASALDGVEEVNYGQEFVERFWFLTRVFLYVDAGLGLIVILSSIFIISNTVRMTILTRRRSISILKLVGATNQFITTPFIIEGAFQGGFASVLSMAMLAAIYLVVTRALPDVTFLSPSEITLYVTTCILLGAVGSYAALRRLIRL